MSLFDQGSLSKVCRCLIAFVFALILQASILFLGVSEKPVKGAAAVGSAFSPLPVTISAAVSSAANVAVGSPYTVIYRLTPSVAISNTLVEGQLDVGQRYLQVLANQGNVFFGDDDVATRAITVTLAALSPNFPLTITATVVADDIGSRQQVLAVSGLGRSPIQISDFVVAQTSPLFFEVFRNYQGVVQQGDPYTSTWRVGAGSVTISNTMLLGELSGGVYEAVAGELSSCEVFGSFFTCALGALVPGAPPLTISYTARALETGTNDHVLQLTGGGESLAVNTATTVLAPALIQVPIDIKPGGFPNPVNPRSRGNIPVAILSTSSFDVVTQLDQASLAFGPTGTEDSLRFCKPEDSNGDGLMDLVCHFDTQKAGFKSGDILGIVTGITFGGTFFHGSDSVVIVPR